MEEHVSSDMLRLRKSPERSQRKVVRKDQLLLKNQGVYTIGLCVSRFVFEKIYSTDRENWDQITPSSSPRALGTK